MFVEYVVWILLYVIVFIVYVIMAVTPIVFHLLCPVGLCLFLLEL